MFTIIVGFFVNLLEKVGFGWWRKYEIEESDNIQNKVDSMSDSDVVIGMSKWERKD